MTTSSSDREQRLERVLADYLHAVEAGAAPHRADLIEQHPDLTADLGSFFRNRDAVERLAEPIQQQAPALSETIGASEMSSAGVGSTLRYFGDYELLEEIARGGMGVVYKARQVSLNRVVAVKMILRGELACDIDVRRFHAEAESAAGLDHANIVPIYEVGAHEGQHYFSMKLIEGGSLAQAITDCGSTIADWEKPAARLLAQVARAVHFAHQRGILHRDLKPANILLQSTDGKPAVGNPGSAIPMVTDFGLAKRVQGEPAANLTQPGVIVGTPSYMAPEQVRAEKQLTTAVDVYSLGAILYEMLTGRQPFQAKTPFDTLKQVVEGDPAAPRSIRANVDRDLETICLKCMHKLPERRYESASAFADDLESWLRGEAIVARPITAAERLVKWARRRPAVAALVAVTFAATLTLLVSGILFNARLQFLLGEVDNKQSALDQANKNAQRDRVRAKGLLLSAHATAALPTNPALAILLGIEGAKRNPGLVANNTLQATLDECLERRTLYGHTDAVLAVAFSPDGRRLVTASKDRTARIWDTATGQTLFILKGFEGYVTMVAFSPDGNCVLTLAPRPDRSVVVWDVATGKELARIKLTSEWDPRFQGPSGWGTPEDAARHEVPFTNPVEFRMANFSPDGSSILTAFGEYPDFTARVWDAATGEERVVLQGHEGPVVSALYNAGGNLIVTASLDKTARIWDAKTGKLMHVLNGHSGAVMSAAFSPYGRVLTIGEGHTFAFTPEKGYHATTLNVDTLERVAGRIWDVVTGKQVAALEWPQGVTGVVGRGAFTPNGQFVVTAGWRYFTAGGSGVPHVWDAGPNQPKETGKHLKALEGPHGGDVGAFHDFQMVGAGANHAAVVWDILWKRESGTLRGHEGPVLAVAASSDGRLIATASEDKTARIWVAPPVGPFGPTKGEWFDRSDAWFGKGGQLFVMNRTQREDPFWRTEAGKKIDALHPVPKGSLRGWSRMHISPDQRRVLLAACDRDTAWIHDTATGAQVAQLQPSKPAHGQPGADFADLEFNNDGSRVHATARSGMVYLFDAVTGLELMAENSGHFPTFSPDGRFVVTLTTPDKQVGTLWDTATGKRLLTLKPSQPQPNNDYAAVAFSPDGKRVLIGCPDHSVRVWDIADGREVLVIQGQNDAVVSPDGRLVLTTADDLTPRLWDAATGKELLVLKGGHQGGAKKRQHGVWGGAFNADGTQVVTCGKEGIGRFWNTATGEELASWHGLEPINWTNGYRFNAYFSPDGRWVLTQRADGSCRLWPTDPLSVALQQTPRDFTPAEKDRFASELQP